MPWARTTRGDNFAVVPNFLFLAVENVADERAVAIQFCFNKAEDVSPDGFHLKESVEDVGSIISEAHAVYVLKVEAKDLTSPGFGLVVVLLERRSIEFVVIGGAEEFL